MFALQEKREPEGSRSSEPEAKLDFAHFWSGFSDGSPEDCSLRDDAHGLFEGGGCASKGTERNPSFLPQ